METAASPLRRPSPGIVAVLPCNDLDASEAFYSRIGFSRAPRDNIEQSQDEGYRVLSNPALGRLHLTEAPEGWLIPERNPFGLYIYVEHVDALAKIFGLEVLEEGGPENKPWGMYEFSLTDPDENLVRVGWPSHLRP
jgi:hypothetical protein